VSGFWDRIAGVYDLAELTNRRANLAMEQSVAQWVSPGSRVLAGCGAEVLCLRRLDGRLPVGFAVLGKR